jgi:hypothetical protein
MWKRIPYRDYFLTAIIINLIVAAGVLLLKNFLPPLVPLLYGQPAGEEQLVATFGLTIAPGVSTLITIINLCFSFWVKDDFLKRILAISAIVISVLTAITVVKIVFLVGFF